MDIEKCCVWCEHFFMSSSRQFSEFTIDPESVGCLKYKWTQRQLDAEDFRGFIEQAKDCDKFIPVKEIT